MRRRRTPGQTVVPNAPKPKTTDRPPKPPPRSTPVNLRTVDLSDAALNERSPNRRF